jgi:hypothetical protein
MSDLVPNPDKSLVITVDGVRWARYPVRTHLVTEHDDLEDVLRRYAMPHLQPGDLLFMSERLVATMQGRAYPIDEIEVSPLAAFLVKHVYKNPYGIGIGSPWTMELAVREAGVPRILLASAVAALTKPFGIRGLFYKVAGQTVASIDGPADYVIPPYNRYAKLGPKDPNGEAERAKALTGCDTVIIDANDLGVAILGKSSKKLRDPVLRAIFKDNPLGQTGQQTPIGIVRRLSPPAPGR